MKTVNQFTFIMKSGREYKYQDERELVEFLNATNELPGRLKLDYGTRVVYLTYGEIAETIVEQMQFTEG